MSAYNKGFYNGVQAVLNELDQFKDAQSQLIKFDLQNKINAWKQQNKVYIDNNGKGIE